MAGMAGLGNKTRGIITDMRRRVGLMQAAGNGKKKNNLFFHLYSSLDRMMKLGILASMKTTKNLSRSESGSGSCRDGRFRIRNGL
jgi:S-adenosylmethionine synthetase